MSITITPETKSGITLTNEIKSGISDTFGMHPETMGENSAPFGVIGFGVVNEVKNNVSISNENKN